MAGNLVIMIKIVSAVQWRWTIFFQFDHHLFFYSWLPNWFTNNPNKWRSSGKLRWTCNATVEYIKGNDTDRILLLDVFAVYGTASELLFQIDPLTKQPSIVQRANDIFGERISAVFIDHKMYQLTLENLKYNDSILFTLRVATINRIYISKISVGKIQLNVKGMEHFMICFLVSKKVNKM